MRSPSQQSQTRTRLFARVLGPFLVIVDITAVARGSVSRAVLSEFVANPLWTWVTGSFVLLGGLTVVALHQYWRGAAAIIVSGVGWLVVLRGVLLLAFPQTFASIANSVTGTEVWWEVLCIAFALVGLYLTYVGWISGTSRPSSQAPRSAQDLPRAA